MYAVIKTGGKQYKVKVGDLVNIELLEKAPGDSVEFDKVLMLTKDDSVEVQVGAPYLEKAKVIATVEEQLRDRKIKILKFKRRKHHMKRMGHRQWLTKIKITEIVAA
jgi:large subunit ribosomal protein L21